MAVLENEVVASRRMWAAFRLGEFRQVTAVAALINALDDKARDVRGRAAAALVRIGDGALPSLRVQLQQGTAGQQLYVAAILGYAGKREDMDRLRWLADSRGQGRLASAAQRSIELINRFMKANAGFIEFAQLEEPDR